MSEQKSSRPVWSGTIILGQVAVPVSLHVAQDRDEISSRTLHKDCSTPIKQKRWCDHCNRELGNGETTKGHEFSPGQFVILDGAGPPVSKGITLDRFVRVDEIPLLYLDRSYHVTPAVDDASGHAYAVLRAALASMAMGGLGRLTMYGKAQLCLIHVVDETIVLTTLFLEDDIRPPAPIDVEPATNAELKLARKAIRERTDSGGFDVAWLVSAGRQQLREIVAAKVAAGDTVAAAGAPVAPVDLADALRESVAKPARRRAPAKA